LKTKEFHKGNKKAQNKRRKARLKKRPPKREYEYELIDGNYSRYPVGYCRYRKGYLSVGLMETHRCNERRCTRFLVMDEDGKDENIAS